MRKLKKINADIVIVGSGVAGLICALELPESLKIVMITKKNLEDSNSYLAQGGISVSLGEHDREDYIEDTLRAGHYKNRIEAVKILVDESQDAARTLIKYGVEFTKYCGKMRRTREGGHSKFRILYYEDVTGKAIMEALIKTIIKRRNISIFNNCEMEDILEKDNKCMGVIANRNNERFMVNTKKTVLATGGIGGIYQNSTSFRHIKGDGIAIAIKHNIKLKDISYVQIHPTTLYENKNGRRFLISESVRGEGAEIRNHKDQRFVDELKPRDYVSNKIFDEMKKENTKFEWLNFKTVNVDIKERFPNIYEYLKDIGINPESDYVPITPAHHYTMGGIDVDMNSKTSMDNLYAIGEVACTGVHGQNRLASNSLLECVVFGKRAANHIAENPGEFIDYNENADNIYKIPNELQKIMIKERIEKDVESKKIEEFSN